MDSQLVSIVDYEAKAKQVLPVNAYDYYRSGAGAEFSLKLNNSAFQK